MVWPNATPSFTLWPIQGDGEGLTDGTVELTTELTNAPPGIYWCDWIQAFDIMRNKTEIENPGIRVRVVEKPGADYEGPEIVNIRPLT